MKLQAPARVRTIQSERSYSRESCPGWIVSGSQVA